MNNKNKIVVVCVALITVAVGALLVERVMLRDREARRVKVRVSGTQNVSGRWVFTTFEMEGPNAQGHFVFSPTNPVVVWPGHEAKVEADRVLLDGAEFARISAAATNIMLSVTSGLFSVRADGVEVKATKIAK